MKSASPAPRGLACYYGDIHNHCNVSYGHGDLKDAFANAVLQLDFASVTGHSSWPDIPKREGIMESVVDYHVSGFTKLEQRWRHFLDTTEKFHAPGKFVTFLSYEVHSMQDGDYTAVFRDPEGAMFKPTSIKDFQRHLAEQSRHGLKAFLLPHHLGYKTGYRGINWDSFSEAASPLVEIVSMHGCCESDDAPFPYLHTMGPRNSRNTMQAGLAKGHHFGVTGSTDHHSAHPGSYGFGKTGVWAEALTREAIWEAFEKRRTFAVSGDRMKLFLAVNGEPLGSRIEDAEAREIEFFVEGGYALDYVEIVKNNRVLLRKSLPAETGPAGAKDVLRGKAHVEVGWGEKGVEQPWEVALSVAGGRLVDAEPRFHGVDIVDPKDRNTAGYRFTELEKGDGFVRFVTKTWGNPTATSHAAQGVSLEIEGDRRTEVRALVNGRKFSYSLEELSSGAATEYLGGFLTGAVCFHRFVPEGEYSLGFSFRDPEGRKTASDFYYLRAAQKNGHWGWSSPLRLA